MRSFLNLQVKQKPDKIVPDAASISAQQLERDAAFPITLHQRNALPHNARLRIYRALVGGEMADIPTLVTAVFAQRMAGFSTTRSEALSLGPWLDRIRAPQPSTLADDATIARGQTLFQSQELGCITCHVGPLYTNNALVDVGTGGTFKVPSLIGIALRAPYMHDGCAATLRDRFGTCGGGDLHGRTSALSAAQLEDLVAFLESL